MDNQSQPPQTPPAEQPVQSMSPMKYKIMAWCNGIFGVLQVGLAIIVLLVVYPQISSLYSDLNIQQNPLNIYIPLILLLGIGFINLFFSFKLFSKKTSHRDRFFTYGLISMLITFFLMGVLLASSIVSIITPIYNLTGSNESPKEQTSQPSPTPDPTANWKTLDNRLTKEFGYSLQYPPNLYPNNGDLFYTNTQDAQQCNYNYDPTYERSQQFGPNCTKQFILQIRATSGNVGKEPTGFHDTVKNGTNNETVKSLFKNTKIMKYNDAEGNSWVVIEDFAPNTTITSMAAEVITPAKVYSVLMQAPKKELKTYFGNIKSDEDFIQHRNKFLYQILSTFKFTQ